MNGNIEQEAMLDMIWNASSGSGIFNTKNLIGIFGPLSSAMLEEYGYIQDVEINSLMKMDKMFNRRYWQKQIKRLANYDIGE